MYFQASGYHNDEAQRPLMEDARRQEMQAQLQQQEAVIDYDSALFEEREEQIRQIEVSRFTSFDWSGFS